MRRHDGAEGAVLLPERFIGVSNDRGNERAKLEKSTSGPKYVNIGYVLILKNIYGLSNIGEHVIARWVCLNRQAHGTSRSL